MRIHLMAVGGTGMGALAGLLKAQGHEVTGCDTALYPPMSTYIERYGIPCLQGFDPRHLDPRPDLVVIGNAIHADNFEAREVLEAEIPYCSMAEAIRRFAVDGRRSLVVAGTHGKTTTTGLCGYLMERAGMSPNLLVGGIVKDFDASFLWGGGDWTAIEGDEYETAFFDKGPKFLHYAPSVLVLNNIEMDHLDNFRDLGDLETAFLRLFGEVREDGVILAGTESPSVGRLVPMCARRWESFGLSGGETWTATQISYAREGTAFRLVHGGRDLGLFRSPLYGAHNLRNTVAALAACLSAGADLDRMAGALPGFQGLKRRQEVVAEGGGIVVVDDFAHHPTALRETIAALRQRFAPRRLIACWEPRSFTCQTNLHQESLPSAFAEADVVFLGPLKASVRIPIERRLDLGRARADLAALGKEARVMESPEACEEALTGLVQPGDLVAFFSSGSFYGLPAKVGGWLVSGDRTAGNGG
jgi:UDP-N-acetylmuramate: L-alanyl-gamma-D-glutamyl-meso-diaminopimelate ligase